MIRLDGKVVTSPVQLDALRLRTGTHRLVVTVTDKAGNRQTRTVTFRVVATYAGAKQLVKRLDRENTISARLASSLTTAMNDAQRADRRGQERQARQALTRFQSLAARRAQRPRRRPRSPTSSRQLKKQL